MGRDRGSVLVWTVFVMGFCAALILGISRVAAAGSASARAQSVADVAALAAVDGGRVAASRVVGRNGARMTTYVEVAGQVTVGVRLGTATAEATATSDGDLAAVSEGREQPEGSRTTSGGRVAPRLATWQSIPQS